MGSYYERPVLLQAARGLDEITMAKVDSSAVMLWLGDRDWDADKLESALWRFIERGTLHLTIAGERAGDSFGVMMEAVAQLRGDFVTVLNVISGLKVDEAVEEFLKHAVPAEAQMRGWKEYRIVLAGGGEALRESIRAAIGNCIAVRA